MRESSLTSTSACTAIFAKLTRKMALRLSRSGGETYRILSSLPGLINAGSYPQNQRPFSQGGTGTYDDIGSVGSCQYDDAVQLFDTVHLREKTEENSIARSAPSIISSPRRRQRINLVLSKPTISTTSEREKRDIRGRRRKELLLELYGTNL
jgi:hypothetical protein